MKRIPKKTSKFTNIIKNHVIENAKAYTIVSLVLLIGIILGVIFVNNTNETQMQDIQTYLQDFTNSLKEGKVVNSRRIIKKDFTK